MWTHTGQLQVEQPHLSPTRSRTGPQPRHSGNPGARTKLPRPLHQLRESLPRLTNPPWPGPSPKGPRGRPMGREGTSGWAPAAPVPGVPAGRLCSPVQHFADPLAHASPGGGGQAPAALSWQVLYGGHHMVRRGRRRWRLQLGLWRLGRDHRCGGGGGWLSERCPAHSARAPGPGTRRRAGRAARAREAVPPAKRRSGEGPAAPAAFSQRTALRLATQSWLHTLAPPGPPPPPSRALPEPRPKSWHTPPSGCEGGRRGPGAAGSTARTVRREERGC